LSAVDRAMARTQLALATSAHSPSKQNTKTNRNKKRRQRGNKQNAPASEVAGAKAEWSDLEQAFFDAAPPDEPEPAAELERFEDLVVPDRQERVAGLGQTAANVWAAFRRLLFGPAQRPRPVSSR
jgi:hypothetical protein